MQPESEDSRAKNSLDTPQFQPSLCGTTGDVARLSSQLLYSSTDSYIKSDQLFVCPSDPTPYLLSGTNASGRKTSYGLNSLYQYTSRNLFAANNGVFPATLAAIDDTSGTICVGDSADYYQVYSSLTAPPATTDVPVAVDANGKPPSFGDGGTRGKWVARHLETANWLFLDGHVKALRISTVAKTNAANEYSMFTSNTD